MRFQDSLVTSQLEVQPDHELKRVFLRDAAVSDQSPSFRLHKFGQVRLDGCDFADCSTWSAHPPFSIRDLTSVILPRGRVVLGTLVQNYAGSERDCVGWYRIAACSDLPLTWLDGGILSCRSAPLLKGMTVTYLSGRPNHLILCSLANESVFKCILLQMLPLLELHMDKEAIIAPRSPGEHWRVF